MKNIRIEKRGINYYVVIADTERFGNDAIMFEGINKEECENYIERTMKMLEEISMTYGQKEEKVLKEISNILKNNKKKNKQFESFMNRCFAFTGDYGFDVDKETWCSRESKYTIYEMKGTKAGLRIVVNKRNEVIRKGRYWGKGEVESFCGLNGEQVWKLM